MRYCYAIYKEFKFSNQNSLSKSTKGHTVLFKMTQIQVYLKSGST